ANTLKNEIGGIVFSIDKWNNTLFIPDKKGSDGLQWFLERIERSESIIMNLILQLESIGVDSILDLGLSKFEHREKFRDFANKNSYKVKIHFLDITKETRLSRVFQRNETKGDTFEFEVTQENFDFMENWFEKPSKAELKNGKIITE
ncbi:MAG: AAA family ATPase, partial [Flavobacteriaceae bacterium]|nr:AAA family ATPase [Flavobacteriaceae bacterium]